MSGETDPFFDISHELFSIRERLSRGETVRAIAGGRSWDELSPEEKLYKIIKDRPTSIASSEFTIELEEVALLTKEIDDTRDWLLEHGEEGTVGDNERLYDTGSIVASTDVKIPEGEPDHRLLLLVEEEEQDLEIDFDFRGNFKVQIAFVNPNEPDKTIAYNSSKKPLVRMTRDEYRIVNHYLRQFKKDREGVDKP